MLSLPILAGIAFFLLHSSRFLQERAARDLGATLSLERQFIEQWMGERAGDIAVLADDPRVLSLPAPALRQLFAARLKASPLFASIAYVDASGHTLAGLTSAPGVDVSDRPYFKAAQRGESYITDVLQSRITGGKVIVVTAPVKDAQGAFRGLVYGTVDLGVLSTLLRTVEAESTSRTSLLQADGTRIAPLGRGRDYRPGDVLFDSAKARKPLRGVYRDQNGVRAVGAYQWLKGGAWLLVAERPESEILSMHAWILGVPLGGATLVFLIFGPVALRLARSLSGPLKRLEDHARQIEAGNYEMECLFFDEQRTPVEVRRLNQAYCLMVDRVRGALEELRQASLTDYLTGAANRKHLFHEGPRLVDVARRGGLPVSVLMFDLDHFKRVNDTHGHAAGDAVLKAFAALLHGSLRKSDLFARFGGEEFVVVAPNAGAVAAKELAERIRSAVELLAVPVDGASIAFTVSIGVATLEPKGDEGDPPDPLDPLAALLGRADEALYAAKSAGRNRVETLPL